METADCCLPSGWHAELVLGFSERNGRTTLSRRAHSGPLRVQWPFYPEQQVCHVYILHPPGGIVGGDTLHIQVLVETGAQVLLTTPAANKFYRSNKGATARLRQSLTVGEGAALEWFPQEAIVFDGAYTDSRAQALLCIMHTAEGYQQERLDAVSFVPLISGRDCSRVGALQGERGESERWRATPG